MPDKSSSFIERCEFADNGDIDSVRDHAKMSALLLYRLIQRAYTSVMSTILDEQACEKERKKAFATLQVAQHDREQSSPAAVPKASLNLPNCRSNNRVENKATITTPPPSVFQGGFCRDLSVVGNLLSQTGFSSSISVKYEALSC